MRFRFALALLISVLTSGAFACANGDRATAYDLGHSMAFRGIETRPDDQVADHLTTCFAIGYREGRLQRLLRTAQPHPPRSAPMRPRGPRLG